MEKNRSHHLVIIQTICLLLVMTLNSQSQNYEHIATVIDGAQLPGSINIDREYVYYFDESSNSIKKITEKYKGIAGKTSPKQTYVSFLGTTQTSRKIFLDSGLDTIPLQLVIFNNKGKFVKSFDLPKIKKYRWSPDETKIVFSAGEPLKEMAETAEWSVSILDINTGKTQKIFDSVNDFSWAKFDGNIYVEILRNHEVDKYNVKNGIKELTSYKGINFSSDGRYYLTEDMEPKIFKRESNEDITSKFVKTVSKYFQSHEPSRVYNGTSLRWLSNHAVTFLNDIGSKSYVYDIDSDAIIDSFDGSLIGINKASKNAVILNRGVYTVKKLNLNIELEK